MREMGNPEVAGNANFEFLTLLRLQALASYPGKWPVGILNCPITTACSAHKAREIMSSKRDIRSEIELQSELNFPRIISTIADGSDSAKARYIGKIREARQGKLRGVRHIEDLGAKFQTRAFGSVEFLKEREVKTVEDRPVQLGERPTYGCKVGLRDGSGRRRIRKGFRIHPLIDIVRACIDVLPRD